MITTNVRRLALCGWLQEFDSPAFQDTFSMQMFLFFCEAFCRVQGEEYDFQDLWGNLHGPFFRTVWEDCARDRSTFDSAAGQAFHDLPHAVDLNLARQASFLPHILTRDELSDFTRALDLWRTKAGLITADQTVPLRDSDFSGEDQHRIRMLLQMYPISLIENSVVMAVQGRRYIISREDSRKLTAQHQDTLSRVAADPELMNPVFVTIDEEGRLLLD